MFNAHTLAGLLMLSMAVAVGAATPQHSDLKPDEHLELFRTSGWFNQSTETWRIPIHGWVYEPVQSKVRSAAFASLLENLYGLQKTDQTKANFKRRTNLLWSDNERGKRLVISIAGKHYTMPESQPNGHFQTILTIPSNAVPATSKYIEYQVVLHESDPRRFRGRVQLVPPSGISVISDIDDTVKLTEVTDRKKLMDNTFYQEFRAIDGMSKTYQQWREQNVHFHFVSSSPWHLYRPLIDFLDDHEFPFASMSLKSIRITDQSLLDLFKQGTETKPLAIHPIFERYPNRDFILVGDSGEQDPEVYAQIAADYPEQIKMILIRNINQDPNLDTRLTSVFKNIPRNKWQSFTNVSEVKLHF